MAQFSLDISRWVEKAQGRADLVVRKVSLDIFRRIVFRSPVDTGRFRGNWQVAIGSMPDGVLELNDKAGTATMSAITAAVAGVKAGDIVFFCNNLDYARPLEYGWSKQAPSGVVRITIQEFGGVVDDAATKAQHEIP